MLQRLAFICLFFFFLGCMPSVDLPANIPAESSDAPNIAAGTNAFFRIIALNVGQGDATLLITPSLKTILIDGGRPDEGSQTILPFFAELGVDRLDYLFASHYDADHIGGIAEVIGGFDGALGTEDDFTPVFAFDRGGIVDEPIFKAYAEALGPVRRLLPAGEQIQIGDGVSIECVIVNGTTADGSSIPAAGDENAQSMGLLVRFGPFRYFTAGDLSGGGESGNKITPNMESLLLERMNPVDALHVSHHGSQTSTSIEFVRRLSPAVALISVGDENDYGHPHPEVLARLHQAGARIYQTEAGNGGFLSQSNIANGAIEVLVQANGIYTVNGDFYESHGNAP